MPMSVGKAVDYSFVRTKEEFDEVLALRTEAYREAGKIPEGIKSADMADSFDAESRIVIGKFKGKVVASARLYFPQYGDTLEQEEFVSWPNQLGRRDEVVEIMRVCTHSKFRSSDLLFSLFRFIAISAIQAKRYKIAGCATDALLPLYTRIGFQDTKLTYSLPALNNLRHTLLVGDARRSILGMDVGPLVWNVIWKDTIEYLVENQFLTLDVPTQFRLMLYRLLSPLAYWLRKRAQRPRRVSK
jgi:predicted GNAT family N-acyltransferase